VFQRSNTVQKEPQILMGLETEWAPGSDRLPSTSRAFTLTEEKAKVNYIYRTQGSSVSIVAGHGLDERAIGVRSPAESKVLFL
jgi:hypothetical protein